MFEREAGYEVEHNDLPAPVKEKFIKNRGLIKYKTVMSWSEHCTECAIPYCFQTCNFYQPREDLKCRRFPDGIAQISLGKSSLTSKFIAKIAFGKWAKLEAVGNIKSYGNSLIAFKEITDQVISSVIKYIPLPFFLKLKARRLYYSYKKNPISILAKISTPQFFMIEVYNPASTTVALKLSIYKHNDPRSRSFEALVNLEYGYNKELFPYKEIKSVVDLKSPFSIKIELMSNDSDYLYFGVLDFVSLEEEKNTSVNLSVIEGEEKKIKCIVWDLDNTLWNGVLIEDGLAGLSLNSEAIKVIYEADRRGILNTIASKNNHEDVVHALKHFGLYEIFVCPQISWEPKSSSISSIQASLNIGIDTFVFIDDQIFEREEVKSVHSDIEVISDKEVLSLISSSRFNLPITNDSANRRKMYQQEVQRKNTFSNSSNDYEDFLRDCKITLEINSMTEENILRAFELAQRTNQMNFSGNRYSVDELREINDKNGFNAMLITASDKFGDYGVVGLVIFDTSNNRIEDLMFSCRIQAKMVDHAIISYLLKKYKASPELPFSIKYKESEKNKVASKIFSEMDFSISEESQSIKIFSYLKDSPLPNNDIVKVIDNTINT